MGYTTKFTGCINMSRALTLKEAKELLEIADPVAHLNPQQEHQMTTETKTPHFHAALMAQYAADAAETDTFSKWRPLRRAALRHWYQGD